MPDYQRNHIKYVSYLCCCRQKQANAVFLGNPNIGKVLNMLSDSIAKRLLNIAEGQTKDELDGKVKISALLIIQPRIRPSFEDLQTVYRLHAQQISDTESLMAWCVSLIDLTELLNPYNTDKTKQIEKEVLSKFEEADEKNRIIEVLEAIASAANKGDIDLANGLTLEKMLTIITDNNIIADNVLSSDLLSATENMKNRPC